MIHCLTKFVFGRPRPKITTDLERVCGSQFWDLNYKIEWNFKPHSYTGHIRQFWDLNYKIGCTFKSHHYSIEVILDNFGIPTLNLNALSNIITKQVVLDNCWTSTITLN